MGSLVVRDCWFAVSHCALVVMCTSEVIVDMQIVCGAKYPDYFYTTSTGPNWYIPII